MCPMMPAANPGAAAAALIAAIVFGALLSEDGATLTAATLAASAVLDARLAFLSAFAGLWVGDLGVYFLARGTGSSLARHRWFAASMAKMIARANPSNAQAGTASGGQQMSLAISRFVPGTRLPAYVSAGLARMPFSVFAAITAFSAIVWLLIIFALIHLAPSQGAAAKQRLAYLGLFDLAVFAILAGWRQCGDRIKSIARWAGICFARATRWEFWPAWLFYPPVAMICAWLGLRYQRICIADHRQRESKKWRHRGRIKNRNSANADGNFAGIHRRILSDPKRPRECTARRHGSAAVPPRSWLSICVKARHRATRRRIQDHPLV